VIYVADGSVIIDTKLDQSGLKEGLADVGVSLSKGITKAVAAAGSALAGLGGYAVKVGSDFEYAISGVAATMGTTVDSIDAIKNKALELGASTKFTATEAADGFNILAMAGLSADEQLQAIGATLNLAAAGEMSMDDAAGYLTTTVKAMSSSFREAGISMDDCTHIADMYAKGATLAKTTTAQLGDAVSSAASVGGAYNQSLSTITTSLLALAEKGYQGSAAGTYLSRAMSDLYAPTDNASKALDALGVSIYDSSGRQRDFIDIVNDLNASFADLTEEEKANYTGMIFTTAGLKAFNSIAGNSSEQLADLRSRLEDCTGAAEQMANTKLDNLQGDIVILQSATEGLGIALYNAMSKVGEGTGMMRDFVQEATDIMSSLTDAVEDNGFDGLVDALGGALAKAVNKVVEYIPLLVDGGVSIVSALVQGLTESADSIADSATSVISSLISGILSITNDLVQLGFELIIALCSGIAQNSGQIAKSVADGLSQFATICATYTPKLVVAGVSLISSLSQGILEALPSLISAVPQVIDGLVGSVLAAYPEMLDCIIELIDSIVEVLPDLLQAIIDVLPDLIQQIIDAYLSYIPLVIECVLELILAIVQALPQLIGAIVQCIPSLILSIIDGIVRCLPNLLQCILDIILAIVRYLPEIIMNIVVILPQLVLSIIDGLIACLPDIIQCVDDLVFGIVKALPDIILSIIAIIPTLIMSIVSGILDCLPQLIECVLQIIAEIVKVLPEMFLMIVDTLIELVVSLAQSVKDLWVKFKEAALEWVNKLWEGIKESWNSFISKVKAMFSQVPETIRSTVGNMGDIGRNVVTGLWNGISNMTSWIVNKVKSFGSSVLNSLKSAFGIHSPSTVFRDVIGKNLVLGLAEGIEENSDVAIDAAQSLADGINDVDFAMDIPDPEAGDYDDIVAKARVAVDDGSYSTGAAISASNASTSYGKSTDNRGDGSESDGAGRPHYVENNIYIDGKKTARVLTPYVSKELEWEGK
jgi:TP901 family phage tail tape measure protein